MTHRTDNTPPDYIPPTDITPAWVWSIMGKGLYASGVECINLRLDLCILNSVGQLVLSKPNLYYYPTYVTAYAPICISCPMSGTYSINGYNTPNEFWKGVIWPFLWTMENCIHTTGWIPYYVPPSV